MVAGVHRSRRRSSRTVRIVQDKDSASSPMVAWKSVNASTAGSALMPSVGESMFAAQHWPAGEFAGATTQPASVQSLLRTKLHPRTGSNREGALQAQAQAQGVRREDR